MSHIKGHNLNFRALYEVVLIITNTIFDPSVFITVKKCSHPRARPNGRYYLTANNGNEVEIQVTFKTFNFNTTLQFKCNAGFILPDMYEGYRQCKENETWSGLEPTCTGNYLGQAGQKWVFVVYAVSEESHQPVRLETCSIQPNILIYEKVTYKITLLADAKCYCYTTQTRVFFFFFHGVADFISMIKSDRIFSRSFSKKTKTKYI